MTEITENAKIQMSAGTRKEPESNPAKGKDSGSRCAPTQAAGWGATYVGGALSGGTSTLAGGTFVAVTASIGTVP